MGGHAPSYDGLGFFLQIIIDNLVCIVNYQARFGGCTPDDIPWDKLKPNHSKSEGGIKHDT
jgi:hypothetical protein